MGKQNPQLAIVNEIIRVISHADTSEQIFSSSLQKLVEILAFDVGAMFTINLETKKAELKAHVGIPSSILPSFRTSNSTINIHGSPYAQVFTTGTPVFYDVLSGDDFYGKEMSIQSLAVIPLTAGSAVLGIFYAGWISSHHFSDDEKGILTTTGQEVGNALFKVILQDKLVAAMTRAEISHEQAEKARDEANFYLDIMTHDINNVNQQALSYLMLLPGQGGRKGDELLAKLENAIIRSSNIIHQVSIIRRIRETSISLKQMDLDRVIREVIRHYDDSRIVYQGGAPLAVYADELIPEIFMNLIGNALKFGRPDTMVTTIVRPDKDMLEVSIRDTGPGIPDTLKPILFQKYARGGTGASGKGLGLYIARMLVERYGGTIWVEDTVPGRSDQGVTIIFTLKRGISI